MITTGDYWESRARHLERLRNKAREANDFAIGMETAYRSAAAEFAAQWLYYNTKEGSSDGWEFATSVFEPECIECTAIISGKPQEVRITSVCEPCGTECNPMLAISRRAADGTWKSAPGVEFMRELTKIIAARVVAVEPQGEAK